MMIEDGGGELKAGERDSSEGGESRLGSFSHDGEQDFVWEQLGVEVDALYVL